MSAGVLLWAAVAAFLFLAWPVAQWAKHPAMKPVAAWLVFVSAFALAGAAAFLVLLSVVAAAAATEALYRPVWAALAAFAIIASGAAAARYAVRRAPRREGPPR